MERKTVIAPVDSETDSKTLFATLKEFPTERMILLTSLEGMVKAGEFRKDLEKLGITCAIIKVEGKNIWEDYFKATVDACQGLPKDSIIINISTADRISQCAMTNAAHVNGLKAVAIIDGKMILLPILKVAYSNLLSEKKLKILGTLEGSCIGSLEDISKKTGISLQLVSYHVNGTPKSIGLSGLELVEANEERGRIKVCLSPMGRLFMQGYLKNPEG